MSLCGIDEYPEVYRVERPRARKAHRCDECRGEIAPGQTYRRDFQVIMGDAHTSIFCGECASLMDQFFRALDAAGGSDMTFESGGLRRAVIEARDEYGAVVEGFEYP